MRQIEFPDYHEFSPEIVIVDEDFDAEMSLPEYTGDIETGQPNGSYYE